MRVTDPGPLLDAERLLVRIGGRTVCDRLSVQIRPGTAWALLGANGVGKSTLLHTLAGIRPAAAGEVRLAGRRLSAYRRRQLAQRLGVVFQQSESNFPAQTLETVLSGRHPHIRPWGWESQDDILTAQAALHAVGLSGMERRSLSSLSGGERRRVDIATLLAQDPLCAMVDEPGNHLDLKHQIAVLTLLRQRFTAGGRALFLVLHDPTMALRFCDNFLLLYGDGRWQAGPAAQLATADRLSELYGYPLTRLDGPHGAVFSPR